MRRFVPTALSAVPVAAILMSALLVLAGCSSDAPPPPCPPVGTPSPLDTFTQFEPGGGQDLTQVRFSGRIAEVQPVCEYDETGADVELAIQVIVERGPADRSGQADLQYFVAVEDGPGNITAKQVFDVAVPFAGNSRRLARLEEIELRIPAPAERGFTQTRVLVGFQLSPEQLEYNRRRTP
jgi:hypothetical protein